ncbi:hypothetical protein C6497_07655 [Candidatus Poribacteria bacterium]|nr:MAG: hypothetical protein C6497_07655 [Candidatus Poribacteria bacterium]
MKTRNTISILSITLLICLSTLFIIDSHGESDEVDIWQTWIDEQTDNILKTTQALNDEELNERRATISNIFTLLADELKKHMSSPPKSEKEKLSEEIQKKIINITTDEILTPDSLQKHIKDTVIPKVIVSDGFDVSKTYPPIHVETHTGVDSFDIKKLLDKEGKDHIEKAVDYDVSVHTQIMKDIIEGEDDSLPKNVEQNVKALRDAYDTHYDKKLENYSRDVNHKKDGESILSYKIPLPIEEVDKKYPRDEWIQMLLDEGIRINSFSQYRAYLLQRDSLIQIEKNPKMWSSGLFKIDPTEDWETYKKAYIDRKVLTLNPTISYKIEKNILVNDEIKKEIQKLLSNTEESADEINDKVIKLVKELKIDALPHESMNVKKFLYGPYSITKPSEESESIDVLKKKIDKLSRQVERLNRKLSRIQSELKSE